MAMQAWERAMRRNVRKLLPREALAIVEAVNARTAATGATIHHPELAALTGGFNSQNINFATMRELGVRAGLIKRAPLRFSGALLPTDSKRIKRKEG